MTTLRGDLAASGTYMAEAVLALARMQAARDGRPIPQTWAEIVLPEERALFIDAVTLALGYATHDTRLAAIAAADLAARDGWEHVIEEHKKAYTFGGRDAAEIIVGSYGRSIAAAFKNRLLGRL